MRTHAQDTPGAGSPEASTAPDQVAGSIIQAPGDEFPTPDTARARAAAAAASAPASGTEPRGARLRRNARQGRLHGYALAVLALVAVLIALAATNTGRVHVDWLLGSSRVSLVWLVLAAAIIGWLLGVMASARFQWLTRPPRPHSDRQ